MRAPTATKAFTWRLLCMHLSCENDIGCGKALVSNFPNVANPANVFLVRAVSDAFGVKRLTI